MHQWNCNKNRMIFYRNVLGNWPCNWFNFTKLRLLNLNNKQNLSSPIQVTTSFQSTLLTYQKFQTPQLKISFVKFHFWTEASKMAKPSIKQNTPTKTAQERTNLQKTNLTFPPHLPILPHCRHQSTLPLHHKFLSWVLTPREIQKTKHSPRKNINRQHQWRPLKLKERK